MEPSFSEATYCGHRIMGCRGKGPFSHPTLSPRYLQTRTAGRYPPTIVAHCTKVKMDKSFGSSLRTINRTKTSNHLLASQDQGLHWTYVSQVARDSSISFNEASIIQTKKGDLVGFLRTGHFGDTACIVRSQDQGKTFTWQSMGFQGHPLNALHLPDGRTLLTYGYRHPPFGIRARILNSECTDFASSQEFILRKDGGSRDLGYPWPVLLENGRILVVYYFNENDGLRHIAGTILEIDY